VKVLVLKNNIHEGPGILSGILENRDIDADIADCNGLAPLRSLSAYAAVFMLGGPESANDQTKKMQGTLGLVRKIIRSDIPYFGICLGLQVLVKAAGGRVARCPKNEIGWRDTGREYYRIHVSDLGRNDPLFTGIPGSIPVFQLHGEMTEPSIVGEVLGFGDDCPVQVVKEGRLAYGIQGHIEIDEPLLNTLIRVDPHLSSMDTGKILSDYYAIREEYTANGIRILSNFLDAVQDG
jgi:GMP synthase-like glutamine amidotransferase